MLSCHKDGENIIDGGKFDGKTLSEVINETGKDILGTKAQKYDFFPILIKLIDAKDNLSVQVHPMMIMRFELKANTENRMLVCD